ncbi:DUF3027 domain-containing protein [Brevibacterium casei]|uniref:DUF3027 domain-containing protein n=2 Tax=Brevibacterium casei TaxID=33889 RepID=A0A7T2WNG1_9MICO|nr:DUF3027 domain-containing protein [Brevibacterium casei]
MMSSLFTTWLTDLRSQSAAEPAPASDVAEAAGSGTAGAEVAVGSGTAGSVMAGSGTAEAEVAAPSGAGAPSAPAQKPARTVVLDAQLAAAIDVARSAIAEVAGSAVIGEHLGATAEGTRLVTHHFVCTDPSYRGWRWVAVLARAPRSKKVTVCETALLPGPDALVAPEWVPWDQRLEPGDLTPRDTLPKLDNDPNLQPGYQQTEDNSAENIDQIANYEFGIGRERVLSPEGLNAAAQRWADSEAGADGEFAARASAHCGSCGYLMPIAGSMRESFGVCANAWSPFDGRVVQLDSGCGAHSETDVRRPDTSPAEAVVDDYARGELELQEG